MSYEYAHPLKRNVDNVIMRKLAIDRQLLAVLAFACITRTIFVFLASPFNWDSYQGGWELGNIARNIVSGLGFSGAFNGTDGISTSHLAPFVPYLWAIVFKLSGLHSHASFMIITTIDLIVSTLACGAYYLVLKELVDERGRYSKHLSFLGAIFVSLNLESHRAITAPWYIPWLELSLGISFLLSLYWLRHISTKLSILWGSSIALVALINPTPLPWFAVPVIAKCVDAVRSKLRDQIRSAFYQSSVATVAAVLLISPWLARNYIEFHKFIPVRGTFGIEFYQGNNPQGAVRMTAQSVHPMTSEAQNTRYKELGESAYSSMLTSEALDYIESNPGTTLLRTARRFLLFWYGDVFDDYAFYPGDERSKQSLHVQLWRYLLVAKSIVISSLIFTSIVSGLIFRIRRGYLLFWMIALYPLPYYITHVHALYSVPLMPWLLMTMVLSFQRAASHSQMAKN